jgi:hypothetical protein
MARRTDKPPTPESKTPMAFVNGKEVWSGSNIRVFSPIHEWLIDLLFELQSEMQTKQENLCNLVKIKNKQLRIACT